MTTVSSADAMSLHRISARDYLAMAEAGLLPEKGIELLDGLVVTLTRGNRHQRAVETLNEQVVLQAAGRFRTHPETLSLRIDESNVPEPDFALSWRRADDVATRLADMFLIIEVSDSSLEKDRTRKRAVYARAGVPEYWIVNLVDDRIERFSAIRNGDYWKTAIVTSGQIGPLALPDVLIDVASVLRRLRAE